MASALISFSSGESIQIFYGVVLIIEAFACFYGGVLWFGKSTSRQHKCRNPERTKLLFEIELMQIRLNRLHSEISSDIAPMLPNEAQQLRKVNKKLPDWFIEH